MPWISSNVIRLVGLALGGGLIGLGFGISAFECVCVGIALCIVVGYSWWVPFTENLLLRFPTPTRWWRAWMCVFGIGVYVLQVVILNCFLQQAGSFTWAWLAFDIIVLLALLLVMFILWVPPPRLPSDVTLAFEDLSRAVAAAAILPAPGAATCVTVPSGSV
eukprot:RCo044978